MKKWHTVTACLLVVGAIMGVYALRLTQWQFVDGARYAKISESSTSFFVKLEGARGELLDRKGNTLAGTRSTYNVVMDAMEMATDRNPAIVAILQLLQQEQLPWVDRLPIVIDAKGAYQFVVEKENEIRYLKSAEMLGVQDYATADECMTILTSRYQAKGYSRQQARDLISVRYGMTRTQFSRNMPYVIAKDVPMDFVQKQSEHTGDMPGVAVRLSTGRSYGDGTLAPHLIGSLGAISQEQYDAFAAAGNAYTSDNVSGYSYTEELGQSGLESAFESVLRGKNGKETVTTGSEGEITKTEVTQIPQAGNSVYLTLDRDMQAVLNDSLKRNVEASSKADCVAGGAVVLDIQDFGVLASSSYPSFDLNRYGTDDTYYYELLKDENKPLFNRALDGIFTPGSVMKPAVALAALEEGVITTGTTVYCDGAYHFYTDYPLDCLGVHGNANVYTGLAQSCNTFFSDIGRMTGIDALSVYANLFALGKRTGLEISESAGIMSNPVEYKNNHGVDWTGGITIQAAIGQADSMFTPLQLATYCATIANNGVRYKTHLLHQVTDFDRKQLIQSYEPVVAETVEISQTNFDIVKEGMRQVSDPLGNAYDVFGNYGIAIGSKTGTAQNPDHSDNTVFIAFAPFDKPEIAVAVVLEYGAEGFLSKSVAKDVFDYYFYGKTLEVKAADAAAAAAAAE